MTINTNRTPTAILAMHKLLPGALVVQVFFIAGCGSSGPERIVVSGEVTYAGDTVEEGIIRFQPIEGTVSSVSTAPIRDGKYSVDSLGGVMPGTYQVQILGYERSEVPTRNLGPAPTQLLPDKYNKASELKLTIESGAGNTEHDFQLDP